MKRPKVNIWDIGGPIEGAEPPQFLLKNGVMTDTSNGNIYMNVEGTWKHGNFSEIDGKQVFILNVEYQTDDNKANGWDNLWSWIPGTKGAKVKEDQNLEFPVYLVNIDNGTRTIGKQIEDTTITITNVVNGQEETIKIGYSLKKGFTLSDGTNNSFTIGNGGTYAAKVDGEVVQKSLDTVKVGVVLNGAGQVKFDANGNVMFDLIGEDLKAVDILSTKNMWHNSTVTAPIA